MRAGPWSAFVLVVALAPLSFVQHATAEESHTFRLTYAAPEGCPSAADMSSRIQQVSARARVVGPVEAAAIDLGAEVRTAGSGFLGVLRVRLPDGTETMRNVPAATCAETVSAMALIAAIVIDPDAALTPSGAVAPEAMGSEPPITPPEEKAPATPATARPEAQLEADNDPPRSARSPRTPGFWFVATGDIGVEGSIAPAPAPDFGLGVGWMDTRRRVLAPSLSLTGRWARSRDVALAEGTAQFERIAARLTGCPLRFELPVWALRPCALLELGSLQGDGSNTSSPAKPAVFWAALGVTGRAEARLLDRFVLGLAFGALFPLKRDRFYFDPTNATAHRVDPVGFVGTLDIGVRFL